MRRGATRRRARLDGGTKVAHDRRPQQHPLESVGRLGDALHVRRAPRLEGRASSAGRSAQADLESASHSSGDELATATTVATVATLYRALFELLPSSVVLVDLDGRVRDVNPAFCRQIGFTREELIGQPVTRFSADPPQVVTRNLARLRSGEVLEHEVVNRHKDGSLRYYELRERMVDLPDGTRAILAVASDITERKRAEFERLELERARARSGKLESLSILAGGVAHDFNSLLTVVLARLELALGHAREDAVLRGSLEESALAARRAADLARQMLAYSGRGRFVARPLQLAKLVAEVVDTLTLPESSDASVQSDVGDGLPEIEGDAAQVVQVASELLANAVEALPLSGGVIRVSVRCVECTVEELAQSRTDSTIPAGRFVGVEFADNGHGMADEVRERMFEPFFSTRRAGRGLGLAAVLGIVRGHKSALFVDSAPGRGARVRVLFPVASRPAVTVLTPPPARPHWPRRGALAGTVLIAEDEDGIRRLMEALLREMGLEVLAASTGEGAVELLREHASTVTFALLDLSLPGISGAETLARLRQLRPDLSAILTSGYERESIRGCQAEAGFIDFLQKPFDIATFRETIESAHARIAGVAR